MDDPIWILDHKLYEQEFVKTIFESFNPSKVGMTIVFGRFNCFLFLPRSHLLPISFILCCTISMIGNVNIVY